MRVIMRSRRSRNVRAAGAAGEAGGDGLDSDRGWRRWLALIVASGGAITGYVIVPDAARTTFGGSASAVAAAWTPNLLLLMVSFALWGLRRSNPTHSRASA
jgi:hypothetical protein